MALTKISNNIWNLDGDPISFLTFPYEIRSTVVEVREGEYLVHSPVQVEKSKYLQNLPGKIKYIVSPNKLHSLFLDDWQKVFPDCVLYAPPGLSRKRPNIAFFKELDDKAEPPWQDTLLQKIVRGSWFMSEVVFFHRPSQSLILGDLIENHDPSKLSWIHRQMAAAVGMLAPHGSTARIFRWTFMPRRETREDIREILAWNPKRVIMNHGPMVETGAQDFLMNAFKWVL